ncbi:hypothetical protein CEXT_509651, partial [Caerostris extrusa]
MHTEEEEENSALERKENMSNEVSGEGKHIEPLPLAVNKNISDKIRWADAFSKKRV